MAWVVRIRSSVTDAELISSMLWDFGPTGIGEMTVAAGPGPRPKGCPDLELTAGYEDEAVAEAAVAAIRSRWGLDAGKGNGAAVVTLERHVPIWEGPEASVIELGALRLRIDAGRSFGHGRHPTTAMALELAVRVLEPGDSVLDVGTGSGALAIAAALSGAGSVTALDIDGEALARARSNAAANGVELVVSDRAVADLDGRFDVVLANLLMADLEPIASAIVERCAEGACLVVTGFLVEQRERVERMLGLPVTDRLEREGWAASVLHR
jgi:ribosomal protein L11 methylase PrmA